MVTHLNILVNFLLRTLVALAAAIVIYPFLWWAPALVFAAVTVLWCVTVRPRWPTQARYLMETREQETIKSMHARMLIIYVFASAVIFQWNIGSWWGWLAGAGPGVVLALAISAAHRRWLGG